jgi:23S rRNA pseudouridine1911/1915/1917 synthase
MTFCCEPRCDLSFLGPAEKGKLQSLTPALRWRKLIAVTDLNHGYEYRKRLGANATGLRVIDYLARFHSGSTNEEWLVRIESGRVLLDGVPPKHNAILRPGQLLIWMRPPWKEPEVPRFFAILYRDEQLLGVAKPEGLPTIPGGGCFLENTLLALVRRHFPKASPLHRLGRGTSGVVLFAITPEASSKISQAWRGGQILKVYRALATGCPTSDEFAVDTPIGPVPHRVLRTIHAACPAGKPAHSHVKVLERRDSCSLLQIRITTGRPHQIRIHLAAAGYPLVGDALYGAGGAPAENSKALPGDLGYHLHSELLGFPHPCTRNWIEITCAPPPSLRTQSELNVI